MNREPKPQAWTRHRPVANTDRKAVVRDILCAPVYAGIWAELLWLIIGVPLALVCVGFLLVGLSVGIALTLVLVGLLSYRAPC